MKPDKAIEIGKTVLKGSAVIKAEVGGISATEKVVLESPLDIGIRSIEVQQGIRTGSPFVAGRSLLIRAHLGVNYQSFNQYNQIKGITARLTMKDQRGNEVSASLSKG